MVVELSKILPLILWLIFDKNLVGAFSSCPPQSSNCTCLQLGGTFEITCLEANNTNNNIFIEYRKNLITLQCTNIINLNRDLLPNGNISETVETIEIKFCPLPETNFRDIFTKILNITNVKTLTFRFTTKKNQTLHENLLDGFTNLETFDFSNNDLIDADAGVFQNSPKLKIINLSMNQIKFKRDHFKSMKVLRKLNLAKNQIEALPEDIFKNLTNLTQLELWNNNLNGFNSSIFDDLINLKILDLSWNKLEDIDGNIFGNLTNLQQLGLNNNKLSKLPANLFAKNTNLEVLRLENNHLNNLNDNLLKNLTKLKDLNMSNCSLIDIPSEIFTNLNQLRVIKLQNNQISKLSIDWFKSLVKLEEIYLNHNFIENLINFPVMKELKLLRLHDNSLEEIKNDNLRHLPNLKELDLSWNRIKQIQHGVFINNQKLIKLNLSHNNYMMNTEFFESLNPFSYCTSLQEFDLSFNQIENVDQFLIINMLDLRTINLSNNRLQIISSDFMTTLSGHKVEIDLSNNNITTVDFNLIELELNSQESYNGRGSIVNLNNNPIICDCNSYTLWKYFKHQLISSIRNFINFVGDDLICMQPENFANISIKLLRQEQLVCQLESIECPINCDCNWRPSDQSIIVDCSYQNLTKMPYLQPFNGLDFKQIEIHLEGNNLEEISDITIPSYENITKLFLAYNRIEHLEWLPPKLQVLDLRGNRMRRLNDSILEQFKHIKNISLDDNPWICDCSTNNFARFLRTNLDKINPINIHCENNTTRLIDLSKNDLCKTKIIIIYTSVVLLIIGLFISVVIAFYYRYQQEIKVWLYARNWCLWWVTEDELDKDKLYDAFISYSNQDEEFVMEHLVQVLENGPKPYKLCLHKRDWIPGEFITKQISNSVQNSKRTIVVLSPNFLESVWGIMEFRTAHTQAMNEGRVRLIVVLLNDIDLNKLDDEIKTYLRTNTYVKWGNPHFWDQLRYALPHSKRIKQNDCKKIDDKSMFTNGFTLNPNSTPPVINIDTGLLKNNPLNLTTI